MLRPLLEYCSPIYHHMLTETMNESLERQQKRALKIIFGFEISYRMLLEKSGLPTLKQRRETACGVFAKKLLESERFSDLFPRNLALNNPMNLRNTN